MKDITIPEKLSQLSKLSKEELIENLGVDPFRDTVIDICLGLNVRSFTEILTRERLVQSNAALWEFFIANKRNDVSPLDIIGIARDKLLNSRISAKERAVYQWLTGLTNKSTQNVLRKDEDLADFDNLTQDTLSILEREAKNTNKIQNEAWIIDSDISFSTEEISWMFLVMGQQTMTIRGSEKSLHGKYFEKLVLGSVFQVLGLPLLYKKNTTQNGFWLSSQDATSRESDATIIYNSKGIRVDIGFIGPGNSEITLDKVSRYRKYDEIAGKRHEMSTIVIVDTIGDRSKVRDLAEDIEGAIVCMSDRDWVLQLSELISERLHTVNPLEHVNTYEKLEAYLRDKMKDINLEELINMK